MVPSGITREILEALLFAGVFGFAGKMVGRGVRSSLKGKYKGMSPKSSLKAKPSVRKVDRKGRSPKDRVRLAFQEAARREAEVSPTRVGMDRSQIHRDTILVGKLR